MESFTFTYRNKQVSAWMDIVKKQIGTHEFHLRGKDGHQLFIFRRTSGKWHFAYGELTDELRDAIMDALIMKYEPDCAITFMYKGERQIVTVGWVIGRGHWSVMVNQYYRGYISKHQESGVYSWHIHNPGGWLLPRHMDKFVEMVKAGKCGKIT